MNYYERANRCPFFNQISIATFMLSKENVKKKKIKNKFDALHKKIKNEI